MSFKNQENRWDADASVINTYKNQAVTVYALETRAVPVNAAARVNRNQAGNVPFYVFLDIVQAIGDKYETKVVIKPGTYRLFLSTEMSNDRGIVAVQMNGVTVATQDCYHGTGSLRYALDLGSWVNTNGSEQTFSIVVTGKNASASNYVFLWEYVSFVPV